MAVEPKSDILTPITTTLASYLDTQKTTISMCTNGTFCGQDDATVRETIRSFERVVQIVVPCLFALIGILGFAGNVIIILVVFSSKNMRNTTNCLIFSLAIADLFFIITSVPFTAIAYIMPTWPFGIEWCKICHFLINVTVYASVYTLVVMSLDRYLAVVHPYQSKRIRTELNAYIVVIIIWILISLLNCPILIQYSVVTYVFNGEKRSACLNIKLLNDPEKGKIFYVCFFIFAYILPLTLHTFFYSVTIQRLLRAVQPGENESAGHMRQTIRVTRMIFIVVVMFAVCWLPIHTVFMLTHVGSYPATQGVIVVQIASNCFIYMNSSLKLFFYVSLSNNFREDFKKLVCSKVLISQAVTIAPGCTAEAHAITSFAGMESKADCD